MYKNTKSYPSLNFNLRLVVIEIFNVEMSLYPREREETRTRATEAKQGLDGKLAYTGRVRRCDRVGLVGREMGHTRADQSISKESTTLPFHKDDVQRVRHRTPAALKPPLPSPPCPPPTPSFRSRLDVVSRRAASLLTLRTLSRALSPYQIESLYFASSIISFINLRAFRTL